MQFMAEYTNSDSGLTFSKLGDDGNDMATTWGIFAVLWAIFLPLGWYLEQVGASAAAAAGLSLLDSDQTGRQGADGTSAIRSFCLIQSVLGLDWWTVMPPVIILA